MSIPTARSSVSLVYDAPIPGPGSLSLILSSYRRPSFDFAPTDAKAACHYPNSARALREAKSRGYDNAVMLDALGQVSELATANIFHAKDGEVFTPAPNGTFLNGITRQRVIGLLRDHGITVNECAVTWQNMLDADEVFSTGNWAKVVPVTRLEDRDFQPGTTLSEGTGTLLGLCPRASLTLGRSRHSRVTFQIVGNLKPA